MSSNPGILRHRLHEHDLTLQELSDDCSFHCRMCRNSVNGGPAYQCTYCRFFLHKFCAEIPFEIQHPLHPQHALSFADNFSKQFECHLCGLVGDGTNLSKIREYSLSCSECGVDIHMECAAATLPSDISDPEHRRLESNPGLQLESFQLNSSWRINCTACRQQISGTAYVSRAYALVLHESCAMAPKEVTNHPLHPQHSLSLVVDLKDRKAACKSCSRDFRWFAYKCDKCRFCLDLNCAVFITQGSDDSNGQEMDHFFHPHPLTYCHAKAAAGESFQCRYCCGTIANEDLYCCPDCPNFLLHKSCAELPREIIHPLHPEHNLIGQAGVVHCTLCDNCHLGQKCQCDFGYQCQQCSFGLDPSCILETASASKEELAIDILHIPDHPMRLKVLKESSDCDRCGWPVYGLAYKCEEKHFTGLCGRVIHKACARLPPHLSEHPVHPQHPLVLLSQPTKYSDCSACLSRSYRFTFCCEYCKIQFHPQCVMMKLVLKHPRHEHRLAYFRDMKGFSVSCNVCFDDCRIDFYRCVPCNYNIHYGCLSLPASVKHEWHIHAMELHQKYINDTFEDQYCDLCETLRHPECGVYVCEECRCAVHIDCVIPRVDVEKRRRIEEVTLNKLDEQISCEEAEIEAMTKRMERSMKSLEEHKKQRQELRARMQSEA